MVGEPVKAVPGGLVTVVRAAGTAPAFSICTLLTNPDQYRTMRESFAARGFGDDCEYLCIDNSAGNKADAFAGINALMLSASAPIVILCHQDVELIGDGRAELEACLARLQAFDPHWAVAGNAGVTAEGWPVTCLSDVSIELNAFGGPLPAKVAILDENLLIVRRGANLGVSRDLAGFHLYGADLCLVAAMLGWNSYVIDFFVRHWGKGTMGPDYSELLATMESKYRKVLRGRRIPLMVGTELHFGGTGLSRALERGLRPFRKLFGRAPRNRELWSERRRREDPRYLRAIAALRGSE